MITSFDGSSCANNVKSALDTPETLPTGYYTHLDLSQVEDVACGDGKLHRLADLSRLRALSAHQLQHHILALQPRVAQLLPQLLQLRSGLLQVTHQHRPLCRRQLLPDGPIGGQLCGRSFDTLLTRVTDRSKRRNRMCRGRK